MTSPFFDRPRIAENEHAFAIEDAYPVAPGHCLVITKEVVADWFAATEVQRTAVMSLVGTVKQYIEATYPRPDGYNVGFNAGEAAGQTVMHLHVHVIPRYVGDVPDPRGGVRHVIADKANYLVPATSSASTSTVSLATGGKDDPFLPHLRPLFRRAERISILAAFVQFKGVEYIESLVLSAFHRGAQIRVLTGDYLHITQAQALRRLLDLRDATIADDDSPTPARRGSLDVRVVEMRGLSPRGTSFHPKAWLFAWPGGATGFVGSSNLSRTALSDGVEWNLRIDREHDANAWDEAQRGYDELWSLGTPVSLEWIDDYAKRALRSPLPAPIWDAAPEAVEDVAPRDVQIEALDQLALARDVGRDRALVVMATGLGKTWLAAFDVAQLRETLGRFPRTLIIAHRVELLRQAARTFRQLFRDVSFGWFAGARSDLQQDVVFASVAKLARPEHLIRVRADHFDYVVVDEVHHADAASYRKILKRLRPRFLLGITATPARADAGSIYDLFDDYTAYEAHIGRGIELGHLVPFSYHGVKDTIDYKPIPWRNRRFDPASLAAAAQTQARMETLWRSWQLHPGTRNLVFCCSIEHADFVAKWLKKRGVSAVAVHSGPSSADREEALENLTTGSITAICSVDLFNEGIDVPLVDRVVMLRPTESSLVFLQQLGRGLRSAPGKEVLTIIDFVGNHAVFLNRLQTLLSLTSAAAVVGYAEAARRIVGDRLIDVLPPGCSVDLELEAKELLKTLLVGRGTDAFVAAYDELRAAAGGQRPRLSELYWRGYAVSAGVRSQGGWVAFVAARGDLTDAELAAWQAAREWFVDLETTAMSKCFKMVVLKALIDEGALGRGMDTADLARRCHDIVLRSPELFSDIANVKALPDPRSPTDAQLQRYWRDNPIRHWTNQKEKKTAKAWFRLDGERFVPRFTVAEGDLPAFEELTGELVEYKLAQYRRRVAKTEAEHEGMYECRVTWNRRDPIVKLPSRTSHPALPERWLAVQLPDGQVWQFKFAKEFCNVAHPAGESRNKLPDLLRGWFGPDAGHPGTSHQIRLSAGTKVWSAEPVIVDDAVVVPFPAQGRLRAFPELRVAAGWGHSHGGADYTAELVQLAGSYPEDAFAVRVSGTSMQGWRHEIRDGNWLVMRWARGHGPAALVGRIVLLERGDPDAASYYVKRVERTAAGFGFASDNPEVPSMPAQDDDVVVAVLLKVLDPSDVAVQ